MMRVLFWLLLGGLLWRLGWRWYRRNIAQAEQPPVEPPVDQFVPCALCGVHVPRRDALAGAGEGGAPRWYCSTEHRQRDQDQAGGVR